MWRLARYWHVNSDTLRIECDISKPDVLFTEFTLIFPLLHMTKICTVCVNCSIAFYRFKSYHNQAALRGSEIKFCSTKCHGEAVSKGLTPQSKPRKGADLICEVCTSSFYRSQHYLDAGKCRFCSEPCRIKAHEQKLIDRTGQRPERLLGAEIKCLVCSETVYRKKSMIDRNINKTCGKQYCVSTYSRSLWKLEPRDKELVAKPRAVRKRRLFNFTAKQRVEWMTSNCKTCGTTENLCLDHILAVSRGGKNTLDNAQTLCQPCNNWKARHVDRISEASK